MKRIITYSIIALLQMSVAFAQVSQKPKLQKREKYEWEGEIPTYVEQLKKELTYPMAWGNSPIRNFKKWKKAAREKVFECMMTPPKAAAAWDMEVLGEEQRDGYKAQKIAFNINAYSRITAYLLIPDGEAEKILNAEAGKNSNAEVGLQLSAQNKKAGKFPAVVALHDHGAHLFIGKEKMIRPFFTKEEWGENKDISEAKTEAQNERKEALGERKGELKENKEESTANIKGENERRKKQALCQEILDDADAWVNQLYDGQYVGDYLAKHGYVVLSIDAPMWGERGRNDGGGQEPNGLEQPRHVRHVSGNHDNRHGLAQRSAHALNDRCRHAGVAGEHLAFFILKEHIMALLPLFPIFQSKFPS